MTEDREETGQPKSDSDRLDRLLAPLFEDSPLWPLLLVGIFTVATFGAGIVTLALLERSIAAMGALALLVFLTFYGLDENIRQRRLGRVGWLAVVLWVLTLAGGGGYAFLVSH